MLACCTAFAGSFLGRKCGMAEKKRFELRVSDEQFSVLKRTAQARGFRSVSAYVQAATTRDTRDSPPDQSAGEAFVAASLARLSKEIRNLHSTQQALFAAVDSLTRLFLTCVP